MTISLFARLAHKYDHQQTEISRRDALKASLAVSAGLLLSSSLVGRAFGGGASVANVRLDDDEPIEAPAPKKNARKVIIVGAGFAGLACGHELASVGYDVSVFEARPRLGGRVLSVSDMVAGKTIEGGGEFIGSNHPAWLGYAKKFRLTLDKILGDDDLNSPILLDGKILSNDEGLALYKELQKALRTLNTDALGTVAEQPWLTPKADEWDSRTLADWLNALNCSENCKRALRVQFEADNGVALESASYLAALAMIKGGGVERFWTMSEDYRCKGGNQQLAMRLAEGIGMQRIRLNKAIARVDITGRKPVVLTKDNERVEADDIVIALPPSVWDRLSIGPPEVLRKMQESRVQMGLNTKFLAGVESAFWVEDKLSPESASDGPMNLTWCPTKGQPGPGEVLSGFAGGPSVELIRKLPPAQHVPACLAAMSRVYPKLTAQKVNARYMNWPDDPWVRASYSFPSPGQVTRLGPLLRDGLGRGADGAAMLHFAGEHCSHAFPGYMEGALQSGAALAKRIVERDAAAKE